MESQFEDEVKLEHVQGYLYAQQVIVGSIKGSVGSSQEYAFYELAIKDLPLKSRLIQFVLERLKYNMTLEDSHYQYMEKEADFEQIVNWEPWLLERLAPWLADQFLNVNFSPDNYSAEFYENFSEEEKAKWLAKTEQRFLEIGERLKKAQPAVGNFIWLIARLVGRNQMEVWNFSLEYEKKKHPDYPYHFMNMYWGMWYDLIIFKNKEKLYLLHLGTVIN